MGEEAQKAQWRQGRVLAAAGRRGCECTRALARAVGTWGDHRREGEARVYRCEREKL